MAGWTLVDGAVWCSLSYPSSLGTLIRSGGGLEVLKADFKGSDVEGIGSDLFDGAPTTASV